jgi:hypothetical protein
MEAELTARKLAGMPLLAGLAEQFTPERVEAACIEALKFPPELVTSLSEAGRVAEYLRATQ